MEIDLDILESAVRKIFSDMRSRGINSVPLEADFYWNIPPEGLYDPYNMPAELDLGQLEEDYENLVQTKEKDLLIGYNLKNVSVLLRYLSDKFPS